MRKTFKKAVALTAMTAVLLGSIGATGGKAQAKAKSYKSFLMFADSAWSCQNMDEKATSIKIKNKKGTAKYTVSLKRSQAQGENAEGKAKAAKDAAVFCVDIKDILKDHKAKDIKISKVTVKCDGKVVKTKFKNMAQGALEPKQDPNKYRLEIYNTYGEGGTKNHPCAKPTAFKWKKSISVSFSLKIKK